MAPRKSTKSARLLAQNETPIQRQIWDALAWRKDVVFWRSGAGGRGHKRFGVKGGGDITGVIKPWGVHFEIECKRAKGGVKSEAQEQHEIRVRDFGGIYILANSPGSAITSLESEIRVLEEKYGRPK